MDTVVLRAHLWRARNPHRRFIMVSEERDAASAARVQIVMDLDAWVAAYAARPPTQRRCHEVIHEDLPCRAFFDLETNDETFAMDEAVAQLTSFFARRYPSQRSFVDLDSGRPGKLSRHLIFDQVVLHSVHELRAMMPSIRNECPLAAEVIDEGVYARRAGTMRVAYSTGFRKEAWLVPRGQRPSIACGVDIDVLRRSLVTHVDETFDAILAWKPCAALDDHAAGPVEVAETFGDDASETWRQMGWDPRDVRRLVGLTCRAVVRLGGFDVSALRAARHDEVCVAARGIFCVVAQRFHASNRVSVTLRLPFRRHAHVMGPLAVRMGCMDSACASHATQWTDERVEMAVRGAFFHLIRSAT